MPASKIAFLGATGHTAGYCLANTLNAGYDCVALARTPAKLTQSMKDKGVSTEALDRHLTIVQGNVKDVDNVKQALQLNGQVVDTIVSGIGATQFGMQFSLTMPFVIGDPTICQDAGNTILQALQQLKPASKPLLINISTTGIQPKGKPRDIPILYLGLYHYILKSAHIDKRVMEDRLREHVQLPEAEKGIRAFINVKPTLLFDGEGYGFEKVRQGIDESPVLGYTIKRVDVGTWMYEKLIKSDAKGEWLNKSLSLAY